MKGFELSTNMIVIIGIAILALAALGIFITTQTGAQQTIAKANEVFSVSCQQYKDNDCAWSNTRLDNFDEFVSACQTLFGQENRAYSCLYNYCCAQSQAAKCDGLCALCKGNDYASIGSDSVESCLERYRQECSEPCPL